MSRFASGSHLNGLFCVLWVLFGFFSLQLHAAEVADVAEWSFSSLAVSGEAGQHTVVDIEEVADQVEEHLATEEGPFSRDLIANLVAGGIQVGDIVTLIPVEAPPPENYPEWVKWHRLHRVANFLRAKIPSTWINNLVILTIGLGSTFLWAQPWLDPKVNVVGGLIDALGVIPLILLPNIIICIDEKVNKAPPGKRFRVVSSSR